MFRIVIPARYASSRLPGKPLKMIGDKSMISHVYQRALEAKPASIVIATDDKRIEDVAAADGADVYISSIEHSSGTERIAEVVREKAYADDDIIVNLQGDEPFVPAVLLHQVVKALEENKDAQMSSLFIPLESYKDVFNPNVVKVVLDKNNCALYFSRAPIPWLRAAFENTEPENFDLSLFHRHIGIYGYRAKFLKDYDQLTVSALETQTSLEQLRVLWNGYKIVLAKAITLPGQEINTEEDLKRAQEIVFK